MPDYIFSICISL